MKCCPTNCVLCCSIGCTIYCQTEFVLESEVGDETELCPGLRLRKANMRGSASDERISGELSERG